MVDERGGTWGRVRRAYAAVAVFVLNTLVVLVLVNAALWWTLSDDRPQQLSPSYDPARFPKHDLAAVYPGVPLPDVLAMLDETWRLLRMEARPWVHYGEAAFQGRWVNVSAAGYRLNGLPLPSAPPDPPGAPRPFRVFCFGGSTMWGYGVPDGETIPAHIERLLAARHPTRRVEVRNYGRAYYFSSQQHALFVSLLRRGEVPDVAVFLDGLNEMTAALMSGDRLRLDEPAYFDEVRRRFGWGSDGGAVQASWLRTWLPMAEAAHRLGTGRKGRGASPPPPGAAAPPAHDARLLFDLHRTNRRLIELAAGEKGVTTLFFWQPVPLVGYDLRHHRFPYGYGRHGDEVLRLLYDLAATEPEGLIDISRMLATYDQPAFVDAHHYTAAVCRRIAEEIARHVDVPGPSPAGAPRSPSS